MSRRPSGRAILAAASDEAAAIEENEDAETLGREAAAAYRAAGEIVPAIAATAEAEALSRRGGRPTSEWMAALQAAAIELDGMPDTPDVEEARADIAFYLATGYIDLRKLDRAQEQLDRMRRLGGPLRDLD